MDPVSGAASLIAFVQIADRIIDICKHYIESVRDYPQDLRMIFVEVSAVKAILENLEFLGRADPSIVGGLASSENDTIAACGRSLKELAGLLPDERSAPNTNSKGRGRKRQKVAYTLTALAWPLNETKAKKLLKEISQYKSTMTLSISARLVQDLKEVKSDVRFVKDKLSNGNCGQICDWLVSTNPSDIHNGARALHEPNTNIWFVESQAWNHWRDRLCRFVWVHGIPGAGKTLLLSHLYEAVTEHTAGQVSMATLYYYCYFGHNQCEALPMLRWLVSQLCLKAAWVPPTLFSIYKTRLSPSKIQLLCALGDLVDRFQVVYFLIDAIDESKEPRNQVLSLVKTLIQDPRFKKMQLLATSREEFDIQSTFRPVSVAVGLTVDKMEADIRQFVYTTLENNYKFAKWPVLLRRKVEDALAVGAKGMSRWAVCQIDILSRLKSVKEIDSALLELPQTLDETYERILRGIPPEEREVVQTTLSILSMNQESCDGDHFSDPAVVVPMIAAALSTAGTEDSVIPIDAEIIKDICGCLVTFEGKGPARIRLAHFTVSEFLHSSRLSNNEDAGLRYFALSEGLVLQRALDAMLRSAMRFTTVDSEILNPALASHSLVHGFYALRNWHLLDESKRLLKSLALEFLDERKPHLNQLAAQLERRAGKREERDVIISETRMRICGWPDDT